MSNSIERILITQELYCLDLNMEYTDFEVNDFGKIA